METKDRNIYNNGEEVEHMINKNRISFSCSPSVKDGYYYVFDFVSIERKPTHPPEHPDLSHPKMIELLYKDPGLPSKAVN